VKKFIIVLAGKDIYRFSLRARPCSPSYSVDILLAFPGNIVIIDVGNIRNIKPPCSDIGAYKDAGFAWMEILHDIVPFALGQTAVDGHGIYICIF